MAFASECAPLLRSMRWRRALVSIEPPTRSPKPPHSSPAPAVGPAASHLQTSRGYPRRGSHSRSRAGSTNAYRSAAHRRRPRRACPCPERIACRAYLPPRQSSGGLGPAVSSRGHRAEDAGRRDCRAHRESTSSTPRARPPRRTDLPRTPRSGCRRVERAAPLRPGRGRPQRPDALPGRPAGTLITPPLLVGHPGCAGRRSRARAIRGGRVSAYWKR